MYLYNRQFKAGSGKIIMDKKEAEVQISNSVKEMGLSFLAEEALIESTIKLYDETERKDEVYRHIPTSYKIATALFLACDSHACIAIPKVQRVCKTQLHGKYITRARRVLEIAPATAHEKLDSLYKSLGSSNTELLEKAHHFISLIEGDKSYRPTLLAATAFYEADRQLNIYGNISQNEISKLTGCTTISISAIGKDLHIKQFALGELVDSEDNNGVMIWK